jgi:hypothetical protein
VGLATAETILATYPETKRTFFKLGPDRVSGCNLFAVLHACWAEVVRCLVRHGEEPQKAMEAGGGFRHACPLLKFLLGKMTLQSAFAEMSRRLGFQHCRPCLLPFAEAAIDVDKPSDHALAELIIRKRMKS